MATGDSNNENYVSDALRTYAQQFSQLKAYRTSEDKLFEDLLLYCRDSERALIQENARLRGELRDTKLDLEDATRSRRDLQQQLSSAQQNALQIEQTRNRNPYIMVLIDGDGLLFNESIIRQGVEGGKAAANALRDAIYNYTGADPDNVEIVAKICANVTGLAKAMKREGLLDDGEDLRNFTLGFTQGKASFDFVDVGHGKERADSKIKECMRFHLRNHNCKHLVLGIAFDAGYAPFLDEVLTAYDHSRAIILEGSPTVPDIASLGLNTTHFDDLFRNEKFPDQSKKASTTPNPSTWAGVSSFVPSSTPISSPTINLKNGPTKKPAPKQQSWSPGPRGLDPALHVDTKALTKIKQRTGSNKLCNNHYLRGPCSKGDDCDFTHDYALTDTDFAALQWLARLVPCGSGQDCDNDYCIYGHHCPAFSANNGMGKGLKNEKGELVCDTFGCRYGIEGHPPGTFVKTPRKEKYEY